MKRKKIISFEVAYFAPFKIEGIQIGERLRTVTETEVERIAKSISEIGLQSLITVRLVDEVPHLVSGHARLLAIKSLGHTHVGCGVLAIDGDEAALHEIDENLVRAELAPEEKRQHLKRRKELWERRQAEAEDAENNGAPCATNRGRGRPKGFAAETAAITGTSKSQINKLIAEPKATAAKTKRKTKRQDGKEVFQALPQERERQSQLMRQQWVAEGHSLEDPDKAVISYWENAWHDAHTREEREA